MIFKTFALLGLVAANSVAAETMKMHMKKLRGSDESAAPVQQEEVEHLDLEVELEGGERKLFPLLPGTKCPPGHTCRSRTTGTIGQNKQSALTKAFKDNYKTPLAAMLDWNEFNNQINTVVSSNGFCSRRQAMARAAGLAAGVAAVTVASPAYAAQTTEIKMGSDSGQLVFVPASASICKGDSVKWINNKGGPHNVVFDEDAIPGGVDQEKISMDEQLGEEGDTFSMKFDEPGTYEYYCEPHRGAGMNAKLTVA